MAPPGQQEPPELSLGKAGGKAVLATLGASQARPPIGQAPSGRDAAFQEGSQGSWRWRGPCCQAAARHCVNSVYVLIGLGQASLCKGGGDVCMWDHV